MASLMHGQRLSLPTSTSATTPLLRHRAGITIRCEAVKTTTSTTTTGKALKPRGGFRYDKANLRWVRDSRVQETTDYINQPLSGAAYVFWPVMFMELVSRKLKSITPAEALALQKKGKAVLVDVRTEGEFRRSHAEGAVSVPMYRRVRGDGLYDNIKRIACAAMFIEATERNTDFLEDATRAGLKKGQTLVLMCSIGGSLETETRRQKRPDFEQVCKDPEKQFGRESRSLKAAYELFEGGYKNVVHLKGGFPQWRYDGLPLDSS